MHEAPGDMTPIQSLLSRISTGALVDPAPTGEALDQIIGAALRAPDHGKLRPWRLVLISGPARAVFAERAIAALLARDPDASMAEQQRMRGKITAPPLIVALGAHIVDGHKIPPTEQIQSVAAAAMNMLNAAHALGFGGKWVTGPNAYDPIVAAELGLQTLIGFLYLGTPAGPPPALAALDPSDYARVYAEA